MNNGVLEKPDYVFGKVPQIKDICIEFGIPLDDAATVTCMYEAVKRCTEDNAYDYNDEIYNDGYREGWNDALDQCENKIDSVTWDIGRLRKN